jgi:ribonucleoside-diphosphate reductase alpha chain
MYLATRDIDETMNIYSSGWEKGLKTFYYLHMKQRHTAEQSTSRVNKSEVIAGGRSFGFGKFGVRQSPLAGDSAGAEEKVSFDMPIAEPEPVAVSSVAARMAEIMSLTPQPPLPQGEGERAAENKNGQAVIACPVDPIERLQCDSCQ